jgi:ABC-2 type transport system ATP-binding protein
MTIDENLQFAAALYNLNKQQATQRIEELLAIFGLAKHRHKKLLALSGGQRRAVDIARGVLHRPKVLFLDEPTIGLDLPNRRAIWRFVEQLRKQDGMTVFLTTQYLEEAEACDRVDFIQQGVLQQGGSPAELIKQQGEYILEVETTDKTAVLEQLTPVFGAAIEEEQLLSFRIKSADVDFYQLQQQLDPFVAAMQWRRPNLNDVYLWTIHQPQSEQL